MLESCLARAGALNADFKHPIDTRPANAERLADWHDVPRAAIGCCAVLHGRHAPLASFVMHVEKLTDNK